MAHLIRKYNPGSVSEPVPLGSPPLSVDSVSAAWYRSALPSSTTDSSYSKNRHLTGTDVISAKLFDSLRYTDTYSSRKPTKIALLDEYSRYPSSYSTKALHTSSTSAPKSVTFAKPPNTEVYGAGSNGYRLPQMKRDSPPPLTSSFPSRSNDVVTTPYRSTDPLLTASSPRSPYVSTYNTSYSSAPASLSDDIPSRDTLRSREERRARNNMLALKQREKSMYSAKEPAYGTDEYYIRRMEEVVMKPTPSLFPSSPTRITEYMYVGGYRDAENWMYLKRLGITHVLNTAAMRKSTYNPYPPESGVVGYESFDADDAESYDVMQHFPRAKAFIDRCKWSGGKVLVHCAMGVNRSGTMCCAYLMTDKKLPLLDAVRHMKQCRYTSLHNRGFRRQLLRYARQKGHL